MADPTDLARLLKAARNGSREAMGEALELCRHYLLAIANRELQPVLRAKGGASDLVQQTFLEAQRDFSKFDGTNLEAIQAWLKQLLLHNVADFARAYHNTAKRQVNKEIQLPEGSTAGNSPLPGTTPTASVLAMATEEAARLHAVLETLPDDYRKVILLRYEEEQPFAEIAQRMGRSENAVRKLWFRAIERLEAALENASDGE
jgi:RNA polymerase sigma-70 factor (ECF subfamily)